MSYCYNLTLQRSFFITALVIVFAINSLAGTYSGGNGSETNPYLIGTPEDLNSIGNEPNDWNKYFILISDINMSGYGDTLFNLIGTEAYPFLGSFDGNNHIISNLRWSSDGINGVGLFRHITTGSLIKDLILENIDIRAGTGVSVGSLVGFNNGGSVISSRSSAYVEGNDYVGVLIGYNTGVVSSCYAKGKVKGTNIYSSFIGGLAGQNYGTINASCSIADVSGFADLGGLTGYNNGILANCCSNGSVTGDWDVGGFVGYNVFGEITNCYSACKITGTHQIGGFIGFDDQGIITKSFWDSEVNPDVNGIGNAAVQDPNVTGKTTAEMMTRSTFTNAGWDFVNEVINGHNDIWDICDGTNYPKLTWWTLVPGDFVCPDGIDFSDFSFFASVWLTRIGGTNWNSECDISRPKDDVIDLSDLSIFTENWLIGK